MAITTQCPELGFEITTSSTPEPASGKHTINLTVTRRNSPLWGEDFVQSLILAHHCAGINVTSPAYIEGVETALQSKSNYLY